MRLESDLLRLSQIAASIAWRLYQTAHAFLCIAIRGGKYSWKYCRFESLFTHAAAKEVGNARKPEEGGRRVVGACE